MWYSKTNKQPTTKGNEMTAMEQVDFSTYTETKSTYDPTAQITILTDTNTELVRSAARLSDDYRRNHLFNVHYANQIAQLEALITENHEEMDSQIVQDLCQIFNLDLRKEVELTVTVTFTATVEVPLDELADFSIGHYDIDASLDSVGQHYEFTVDDCVVDSIEYETS